MSDGTVISPGPDTRYFLHFRDNGRVSIVAACNRALAFYSWQDGALTRFQMRGANVRNCGTEWQALTFIQSIANVNDALLQGDDLYLLLAMDSGSMHFTRR